jgi:hypothetical protein
MNSGVVNAIDLGWRLAAILKGYGGEALLKAYSDERRPMIFELFSGPTASFSSTSCSETYSTNSGTA